MPKTLASILHPLTPVEFSAKYYSKTSLHIKDSPSKFQRLFGWGSLNRILNSSPVPHPTMKMVLEGKPVLPEDAKDTVDAIRNGASLVLEEIHRYDLNVGKLAAGLANDIGEPVRVNLYLSQPGRQGYNRHYDTHDVFILQIAGYKGWQVYDFTIKFPLFKQKGHHSNPPDDLRLGCTLGPGDVLYIPRGHWHEATAQVEPSMHLTVGLYARTGIDFLTWLTNELRADVRWRETFPLILKDNSEQLQECDPKTTEYFEILKRLIDAEINEPSLLDKYRRFCIAQERKVDPFSFPSQILETERTNPESRFARPDYQQVSLEKRSDGKIELIVWGNILTFSGPAENILRYIFSTFAFSGHDLLNIAPELRWDDISTVLRPLLHEELIIVVDD
jgi:ribosomal protein L16 Arg81 hydroxylase